MKTDIIGLRGGHSLNCKGAVGLRHEYECMQELYIHVKNKLEKYGKRVIDCNSNNSSEREEVREGAIKANKAGCDLFVSLHMNSFNGSAHGTECFIAKNSRAENIAKRICNNLASLGLENRGVKVKNYWEMQDTNMPNIIVETLFLDNAHDVNEIWSPTPYSKLAGLICNGIDPNIPVDDVVEDIKPPVEDKPADKNNKFYRVVAGSYNNRSNAEKIVNELSEKGYPAFIDIFYK